MLQAVMTQPGKIKFRDVPRPQDHLITIAPGAVYSSQFDLLAFDLPAAYRVLPAALPVQLLPYKSAANLGLQAGVMRSWIG